MHALLCLAMLLPTAAEARIERSAAEVLAFKRQNPCPSTQLRRGACPGFQVDHKVPLKCDGLDKVLNLQWLTVKDHKAKTRAESKLCLKPRLQRQGVVFGVDSIHAN